MALTDYKIVYIRPQKDGTKKVLMRIYEGAITTKDESDGEDGLKSVTRYRRTSKLREKVLYVDEARSDLLLRDNCDVELNTDDTRTSIDGQQRTVIRA